jgi:FKBP-type peptidyl-prolyl cis-trans isomerase FkpA
MCPRRRLSATLTLLLVATLPGCLDGTGPEPLEEVPISEVEFAAELGIDLAAFVPDQSGIWVREDEVGTGSAILGGQVAGIHYSGWVSSGQQFDQAEEEDGPPVQLVLGAAGPIGGLTAGIRGMRVGGQRTVLVPPRLGFGGVNLEGIPPNSWLVLRIRLRTIDGDDGTDEAGMEVDA